MEFRHIQPSAPFLHNQGEPPPPYSQYYQGHPHQNYATLGPAGGYQQNPSVYYQQQYQQQDTNMCFQHHDKGQYNTMPNQQIAYPTPGLRLEAEEVRTYIRLSICCCITWILLLALPAIPFGLCAFFCSLYSRSLRDKGDTKRANKRGSNALCAMFASIPFGFTWTVLVAFAIIVVIINSVTMNK